MRRLRSIKDCGRKTETVSLNVRVGVIPLLHPPPHHACCQLKGGIGGGGLKEASGEAGENERAVRGFSGRAEVEGDIICVIVYKIAP